MNEECVAQQLLSFIGVVLFGTGCLRRLGAACAPFYEMGRKSYLSRWLSHPRVLGPSGDMIVIGR